MNKTARKTAHRSAFSVLGAKAFAAIAAVEGLRLSPTSKQRLNALKNSDLTPEERRAEIFRAYKSSQGSR
jgi:hypothetical protein